MSASPPWKVRACNLSHEELFRQKGFSHLLARLLASRTLEPEELDSFFEPTLTHLASPHDLPGVKEAVEVILPFIETKKPILVFGDYDVDGVCASAILVTTLRRLGATAEAFIPLREGEGYGMSPASLTRLFREHPDVQLVITVDNGITSPQEVATLKARGVQVVVTDHHLPGAQLPPADVIVNPRVKSAPSCEFLCGAGVAFFLANALTVAACTQKLYTGPKFAGPLLVLAGLATVADIVPLLRQNRILASQALAYFNLAPLGLRELLDRAQRRAETIRAHDFGFTLGPRINAAGRMTSARLAYDLMMTTDREKARALSLALDHLNVSRKMMEQRMTQEAQAQMGELKEQPALVAQADTWHAGIAGIVASRLMEEAHVPVAVIVRNTGSVRAPEGYHVQEALTACANTLTRFGGHAAAGGFTLKEGALDAFRTAFQKACSTQKQKAHEAGARPFDGWLEPQDLTLKNYDEMCALEPFGEGNPEPVFGLKKIQFSTLRTMGHENQHATLTFVNQKIPRAVWWGQGARAEILRAHLGAFYDILFSFCDSDYGGLRHLELRLVDVRPSIF